MAERHPRSALVLDPSYSEGLEGLPEAELRTKHAECLELETEVSYVRRLTQARIDILEAELDRRASGRTLGDLIDDLPRILADSGPRGNPATSRIPQQMAPEHESEWAPELARFDGILANVTLLGDEEVRGAIEGLRGLEREVSDQRRKLFTVIDAIDLQLARTRQ
jgi:hypothetical protein